ncbi:family 20 glycosylhydrolase [Cerasicoccus frondis]|uniref:family 20 glycosylhydrolase n=1 Tax=Cerasicoccus frondis TaxID=490090 RepID=UPI002852937F|nr:family 20 glycosylhydrolase [Cerasicoccus frondis]
MFDDYGLTAAFKPGGFKEKSMYMRGFMIDSARCMESREYYRRFIQFCAAKGLNTILWHFSDDQGLSLELPSEPGLADKHAYRADEMRDLIAYAERNGITLIPELETLGHSRYITRRTDYQHLCESDGDFTAICPLHPETRSLMKRLLGDVADIFPSPWIHVGLDEIKLGGHPLTREALKTQSVSELLAEYVSFIYNEVKSLGRKMIMWVDQNSFDTGFIQDLPRDILIAVWQYHPDVTPELAQRLLDTGFDVLLCPALITYDQQAYPGKIALPNIERMSGYQQLSGKGKVVGALTTIWTPMRFLHDSLWPSLSIAADTMLSEGNMDISRSLKNYIRTFHDAEPTPGIIGALKLSFDIAPKRKEYLSILTARPEQLKHSALVRSSADWSMIADQIKRFLPIVRSECRTLETLRLFAGWMSYLYKRAALLKSDSATAEETDYIVAEGEKWLGKLEQVWDHERFADDPRRFAPVFDWEEAEYLLINFRKSLQVVEAHSKGSLISSN